MSAPASEQTDAVEAARLPPVGAEDVVFLIDISGYVFRAFYALPPLTSEKGEPTGALYGVTSMILKLVKEQKPHMLAVVCDGKGHSFRKQLYEGYKANRPSAPDDLKAQMGRVREVADAYAIPCYEREGVEADDLIASLVRIARAKGHQVVIVSADKDLLQLVGDGVSMLDTMKNKVFGPRETVEKLGVTPAQVRDYLSLVGDTSDNIPGVPSVGPKTATELLTQYGTLDGIYEALPELKKKALKAKLEDNRALAFLSRDLVTLKDDFELPFSEDELRYGGWDNDKLRTFLKALAFTRLLTELDAVAPAASIVAPKPSSAPETAPLRVVTSPEQLVEVAAALEAAGSFALYTASENDEPIAGDLVGVAFAWADQGAYVPLGHVYLGAPTMARGEDFVAAFKRVLESHQVAKRTSSKKRDLIALAKLGIGLSNVVFDTMLGSYLNDADLRGHGIRELALRRYALELPAYAEIAGKGKNQRRLSELTIEEAQPLIAPEVGLTLPLSTIFERELHEAKLDEVLHGVELPLADVLADMEARGVRVDPERLGVLGREVDLQIADYEKKVYEHAGKQFNIGSPRQLETILFDELGLPVIERTKTARSTNADVLEELAGLHALPAAILEHRQLAKLKGTYLDALPREINPKTGRIHTKFEQAVAATGRLSSNDPNLQNIPIRTEIGRAIRSAFVAEPGFKIFAADYSQIELRVLAHMSGDPELSAAFNEAGADVHVRTATALFGVPLEAVTRDQRAAAKTVNFAVIYGQTQFALARNLRIERGEASRYIKAFFERYAGVRRYLDTLVDEARSTGAVRTITGRRRVVRDILSKNFSIRGGAERIAQNMPIQGSAADIMKLAMVRVHSALQREKLRSRMVLTVHDELVFEGLDEERSALEALVRDAMENAMKLDVPLVADMGWGDNWGEAH
ncbi:MAG TPA: DNA polymerase I [Polyangiales bacterium]|nr:DNA polymerase I [Polyangiales bacterium]